MPNEPRRFVELDGVRGLAILLVVVYHVFDMFPTPSDPFGRTVFAITSCGWAGVDLFFVLSGFLITGILLRTKGRPGYFQNFFARRALRILPLYYGFLVLLVGVSYFDSPIRDELNYLQTHQAWYWLHVTNWLVVVEGDYNNVAAGYLWSLSVEEQFYLVWPFVVLLLDRSALARLCIVLFATSLLGRYVAYYQFGWTTTAVYAMTLTHLEPLLVGAGLALLSSSG
ncbi:acyltransferase, partial [Pirellulales bacterium]|nr:acyltransferase [Pirellulales bacterium]